MLFSGLKNNNNKKKKMKKKERKEGRKKGWVRGNCLPAWYGCVNIYEVKSILLKISVCNYFFLMYIYISLQYIK